MTVEIFLSDFQGIVYGVFRIFISTINVQFSVELFFLLLDCRMFAFPLYGFAVHLWEWDGNDNNPVGILWEWL